MDIIRTKKAPSAIGPYSQAVKIGDLVFCSGQIALDPATKSLAGSEIKTQTLQVFENIQAVLRASGLGLKNVVKTTVFLSDMDDFPTVNEIYAKQFAGHKPARTTMQVARLPMDALIEIECIAVSAQ